MTKKTPKKRKIATPSKHELLWAYVSRYVKERDNWRCYTCGAFVQGSNAQAGHFVPSSLCNLRMRYDVEWLRVQCMVCNCRKSGNYVTFRENLVKERGEKAVRAFELERHEDAHGFDHDALVAELETKLLTEFGIIVLWKGKKHSYLHKK
jgi:hypothetical protein